MPFFPHSLIGFGPFSNQGCRIVFNKATVTIFHPDGNTILEGWRELDGFPLTVLPRPPAASTPPPPTLLPPLADLGSGVPSAPNSNILSITKLTGQESCASHIIVQPFPSQGINATNEVGKDFFVYYLLYGVAQATAMAAHASNTASDPQSLNLPGIGAQ